MNNSRKPELRIIGGRWRRRNLGFSSLPEVRPTPNRVRETLFNWLSGHIEAATCLDLFAGSGALSFEAISRGAASATLVEKNPLVCKQLEHEIARFNACTIHAVLEDAYNFVHRSSTAYDIVFIDPPFGSGSARKMLETIAQNDHILEPDALIYAEWDARDNIEPPGKLKTLCQKQTAGVRYALFEQQPPFDSPSADYN